MSIIENIKGHEDISRLSDQELITLCSEIRSILVDSVSKTGGHLASNLGVVELAVAIEAVYNTKKDRLVFDVGHQSYVHKLLTGRQADFGSLRQFGGIAGFPKPSESITDSFIAGHASSSISVALGMARARSLQNQDYHVVAVLGDGAATGGMVYEGLNDAAVSAEPMVVILNDNEMSIGKNVGGMAKHLLRLRSKVTYLGIKNKYRSFMFKIPGGKTIYRLSSNLKNRIKRALIGTTIFENMGFIYLGPVNGHDVLELIPLLKAAKDMKRPVLVHVVTKKGKGYLPAEQNPAQFHGVGAFVRETGEISNKSIPTFSGAFGKTLCTLAKDETKLCAITAAMPGGTGLLEFQKQYPGRLFDVGIAEEHAVSMAGGLCKQGMIPVVAIYSTFLQRAYDMILQDICMMHLPVVFAVDRAGLVGEDGETHHGVFDVGFLRQAPGMRVLCPASILEQQQMLTWAVLQRKDPVAVRYPRGGDRRSIDACWNPDEPYCVQKLGSDVNLITYGVFVDNVLEAADMLVKRGVSATVLRLTDLSADFKKALAKLDLTKPVVILEEVCSGSGIRGDITAEINALSVSCPVYGRDLGPDYVTHGNLASLYKHCGLDATSICDYVLRVVSCEN